MKGIQKTPWLAALQALNGGENPQQAVNEGGAVNLLAGTAGIKWRKNPQQAAVNEGAAVNPLAGIAGIKWREKPSAGS